MDKISKVAFFLVVPWWNIKFGIFVFENILKYKDMSFERTTSLLFVGILIVIVDATWWMLVEESTWWNKLKKQRRRKI